MVAAAIDIALLVDKIEQIWKYNSKCRSGFLCHRNEVWWPWMPFTHHIAETPIPIRCGTSLLYVSRSYLIGHLAPHSNLSNTKGPPIFLYALWSWEDHRARHYSASIDARIMWHARFEFRVWCRLQRHRIKRQTAWLRTDIFVDASSPNWFNAIMYDIGFEQDWIQNCLSWSPMLKCWPSTVVIEWRIVRGPRPLAVGCRWHYYRLCSARPFCTRPR